jgi:predicted DsbA family dithiol-disulfide isomerase
LTKDITSFDTLAEAAEEVGIDKVAARKYLIDNENNTAVADKIEYIVNKYGIEGIPFYIINDGFFSFFCFLN